MTAFRSSLLIVLLVAIGATHTGRTAPGVDASRENREILTSSGAILSAGGGILQNDQLQVGITIGQPFASEPAMNGELMHSPGFWGMLHQILVVTHSDLPETFFNALQQNFPNPFNPLTRIVYTVAKAGPVTITIYDVRGQRIRSMTRNARAPGRFEAVWDGRDDHGQKVSSGVYLYRLESDAFTAVKKMLMIK